MEEIEKYIRSLIRQQGMDSADRFEAAFRDFVSSEDNINSVKSIRLLQEKMTKNWQIIARREDIKSLQIALPNGIEGKLYEANFNLNQYGLNDITVFKLTGFENTGLEYNPETGHIKGIPKNSGDIKLDFTYNFEGESDESEPNQKSITIIMNPDPKSLWKNIPSDDSDQFSKPDEVVKAVSFLEKNLLMASKRGRSHANKGSFREDDFAFAELDSGWGILAISDGAGSSKYSRKSSAIAVTSTINYFTENFTSEHTKLLDEAINVYQNDPSVKEKLQQIANNYLLAAAQKTAADIRFLAEALAEPISDFHATLAFVLVKKYSKGYAFLSFGVGDCPMVLVNKNFDWVKPLNTLDVGEFGGGTRFITMPEIFKNDTFNGRFNFEFIAEFPYLVLMSDGIYDAKFEVEANLQKPEKWQSFFDDLQGDNSESVSLEFDENRTDSESKLSQWMDFWSPGNHDDRTLAILF